MEYHSKQKPFPCKLLIFLQLFLGIGAAGGGIVFVISPTGAIFHMPISLLKHSPFNSFLIPGIILLVILGIFPLLVSFGLITGRDWKILNKFNIFTDKHWSWGYSLYLGFALIIWISVQVFLINAVTVIHIVYIALGLAIQVTTLLPSVQAYYQIEHNLRESMNM
jgi:hypothetical protein